MIEFEKSYIFTVEDGIKITQSMWMSSFVPLEDYYLNPNARLRVYPDKSVLTQKTGNKCDGRKETDGKFTDIATQNILKSLSQLTVKKERREFRLSADLNDKFCVTMDIVSQPMKIAILEIESIEEKPVPDDVVIRLLGFKPRECHLSAWDFFKRKIGICGGPSSGKSETAKSLSHIINTQWSGNAFHVVEYATTFIQKYRRRPHFAEQLLIWLGQHNREQSADLANVVISDCPTFLAYVYAILHNDMTWPDSTAIMEKLYEISLKDAASYSNLYFLQMISYASNGVRYQSSDEAKIVQDKISAFLNDHKIPHMVCSYKDSDRILKDMFFINDLPV